MNRDPKILAFLCHWCSYSGADSAGSSKLEYPPHIDVIRVMCTGRIDPSLIIEAFVAGNDGVLICGCHIGDCHYINGNEKALTRFQLLQKIISDMGIENSRLRLEWVSANEGERYASILTEMTEHLRSLGPLELSNKAKEDPPHQLQE